MPDNLIIYAHSTGATVLFDNNFQFTKTHKEMIRKIYLLSPCFFIRYPTIPIDALQVTIKHGDLKSHVILQIMRMVSYVPMKVPKLIVVPPFLFDQSNIIRNTFNLVNTTSFISFSEILTFMERYISIVNEHNKDIWNFDIETYLSTNDYLIDVKETKEFLKQNTKGISKVYMVKGDHEATLEVFNDMHV